MKKCYRSEARCAVVVPIYRKPTLLERLSLGCLQSVLKNTPKYIIQPASLGYSKNGFASIGLDDRHFNSLNSYAWLMVSSWFYELFQAYEYILVYQLDCLIFKDALDEFCDLGYDYIAPPFLAKADRWPPYDLVGVGGFSLRRVESHRSTLHRVFSSTTELGRLTTLIDNHNAEDVFWGQYATQVDPRFKPARIDDSLKFGFNGDPRPYLVRSRGAAPLGCHHWLYHGGTDYYISLLPFSFIRAWLWRLILKFDSARRITPSLPVLASLYISNKVAKARKILASWL